MNLSAISLLIALSSSAGCGRAKKDSDVDALRKQVAELQSQVAASKSTVPSEPAAKTSLTGTIFYRKISGDSMIVRALPVYLLRPSATEFFEKFMALEGPMLDVDWRTAFIDDGERFFGRFDRTLRQLQAEAVRAAAKATTDADGKFVFQATTNVEGKYIFYVPAGKYRLLAELDSADAKGFWYVDVDVAGQQQLDLDNSNITKIYDRTADSAGAKVSSSPGSRRPVEEEPDYIKRLKEWNPKH